MSGFEVVGVVLGVLPLVIEAVKAGQKARASIRKAERAHKYLTRYLLTLKLCNIELEDAILKVVKDANIQAINDTNIRAKQSTTLFQANAEQIATYLGKERSSLFALALEESQRCCQELVLSLSGLFPSQVAILEDSPGLLRDMLRNHYSASVWEHPKSRIKFLHRQSEIEEALGGLEKVVRQLTKLARTPLDNAHLVGSDANSPQMSAKKMRSQLAALDKLQKASSHLRVAVTRTIPGDCDAHDAYSLRLVLESHNAVDKFCINQNPSFMLEIAAPSMKQGHAIHHMGRIVVRQNNEKSKEISVGPDPARKRVKFIAPVPNLLPTPSPTPSPTQPVAEDIFTLCTPLSRSDRETLTIYVSEAGVLQCQKSCSSRIQVQKHDMTTLADILERTSLDKSLERTWTRQQRINLGYVLASNLLQLNCSNWVPDCLNAATINFYVDPAPAFDTPPFDASQPFLENLHSVVTVKRQPVNFARQWSLDLAILLLELWKGRNFEIWLAKRKINNACNDHENRRNAAEQWFDEISPDMLSPYKDAAQRCLEFSGMLTYRWDAKEFRERFFECVVGPLETFTKASRMSAFAL